MKTGDNFTVYKITNLINGKLYFGITKLDLKTRWIQHKCNSTRKSYHLYRAILRYGINHFSIEVVKECRTEVEMYQLEKELISKYDTTNPDNGYNNSTGGEISSKGTKRTIEQIKKMSEWQKIRKRKPHSEETKKNMKKAAKGRDMTIPVFVSARLRKGKPAHNRLDIYSIDKDHHRINYGSITEASKLTGTLIGSIGNNLTNKSKTAGGLTWHYQQMN